MRYKAVNFEAGMVADTPRYQGSRRLHLSSPGVRAKAKEEEEGEDTRKVDVRLPGKGNSNSHGGEAGPPYHHDDKVDSDQ